MKRRIPTAEDTTVSTKITRARRKTRKNGKGTAARGYAKTASNLVKRGKRLAAEAYGLADAARKSMPAMPAIPSRRSIEALSHNAVVMGALGVGIGVVIGAMLPRETVPQLMAMGATPHRRTRKGRSGATKRAH